MREVITKNKRFLLVVWAILFLSFFINLFGAMRTDLFVFNYSDSDALVINQIACKGQAYDNQMLMVKDPARQGAAQTVCTPSQLEPYQSQYGLQGKVYTAGYRIVTSVVNVRPMLYVAFAQAATALLSAFLFALFILWAKERYGSFAAGVTTFLIGTSPILVGVGRDLYWTLPLMIAPFIYALYAYSPVATLKRKVIFWAVVGLLFYLRFLCGYEFLTTVTVSVAAAIAYYLFEAKSRLLIYVREFALVLGIGLISFAAALGTHVYSISHRAGSMQKAAKIVQARAFVRTTDTKDFLKYPYLGFKANLPDTYTIANSYMGLDERTNSGSAVWGNITSVIHYNLMPVFNLPIMFNQPFETYAQSFIVFTLFLILLYVKRAKWLLKKQLQSVNALYVAGLVGLGGYWSWIVMARAHSLVHVQITGVLAYVPFALFGYVVIGLYLEKLYNGIRRSRKK